LTRFVFVRRGQTKASNHQHSKTAKTNGKDEDADEGEWCTVFCVDDVPREERGSIDVSAVVLG
jgi:hypothetical protein